jgi:hypothetical protein
VTGSFLSLVPVECFHHAVPVVGVDAQQFTDDESNRPAFAGSAGFHPSPEARINASQLVVRHRGCTFHHSIVATPSNSDRLLNVHGTHARDRDGREGVA